MKKNLLRLIKWTLIVVVVLIIGNWMYACRMLWTNVDRTMACLSAPAWPLNRGVLTVDVSEKKSDSDQPRNHFCGRVAVYDERVSVMLSSPANKMRVDIHYDGKLHLSTPKKETHYVADETGWEHTRQALLETSKTIPRISVLNRLKINLFLHPFITGFEHVDGACCWRVRLMGGKAVLAVNGELRKLEFKPPRSESSWLITVTRKPLPNAQVEELTLPQAVTAVVKAGEMDRSLAAVFRIAALRFQPAQKIPDGEQSCGKGHLRIRNGNRMLYLSGTSHEIGYQHGKLLADSMRRMYNRVVYGVGLYYSLEKGKWFLDDARKLVERQRQYIDPAYFEEMKGMSEGSGISLDEIQIGNIFPEFFHCSGAALFGKATLNGQLLHVRVLDYMTDVGLQDEAVVMAVERTGVNRFVNVSFAGFIGSVTGMNEKKVAIGEMGGRGEGLWDGTPMSFLLRGALEHAATLDEAVAYMRDRRRTCEYYYVISDAKIPDAVGVAATPDRCDVVKSGQAVEQLPEAVENAVLLSAGNRYKNLVKRVRENYGKIDARGLIEIIKRPVAMRSNLHDAIFESQDLRVWVLNASRREPACDQPPAVYEWTDLFPR
ncbi:MAG: C45 family autoproteolytic acyltransferase/hydrolase [Kiritimatiellae bacterium]|nr:C45 family autoproteolytic acyltransferase/hydrolase [Kiritimatiellia bacterium]MDD5519725.1 C45 family autoproteolytic acyltransferase/hydrolase [Kiritimatiellia bacterium]